jgi:hypothetical protein
MDIYSKDFFNDPLTVVVVANLAAISLVVLGFLIPGSSTVNKNWNRFKLLLTRVGDQGVYLLPALSALVLPTVTPSSYLMVGGAVWLTGVGIGAAVTDSCINNDGSAISAANQNCSKSQLATQNLALALEGAGVSLGVGALLAYVRELGKLE